MKVLIPLPDKDFELTEVAIPWKLFKEKGYDIVFATESGSPGETDQKLITGVIFGQLKAKSKAIEIYREMRETVEFKNPIRYMDIEPSGYNLLHLPGGHAKGMRQYLENIVLQEKVLAFFQEGRIIGAICHGSIVLARTINPETGNSIIYDRNVSALTKRLERLAYYITAWKLGDYYRTYPEYVEDEVSRSLKNKNQFKRGGLNFYKPFVCEDDNLVTARWPEDAYLYAETLIRKLERKHADNE